jgi:hypothetical protein
MDGLQICGIHECHAKVVVNVHQVLYISILMPFMLQMVWA